MLLIVLPSMWLAFTATQVHWLLKFNSSTGTKWFSAQSADPQPALSCSFQEQNLFISEFCELCQLVSSAFQGPFEQQLSSLAYQPISTTVSFMSFAEGAFHPTLQIVDEDVKQY